MIIPLYSYPGDSWNALLSAKAANPSVPVIAIINHDNGPGTFSDPNYTIGIQKLQSEGIVIIGYVDTHYTKINESYARKQINLWHSFYSINGIFFDQMSNLPENEGYYLNLTNYAKSIGYSVTVGNPGTATLPSYIGTVNTLVVYEDQGLPQISALGSWQAKYGNSNFSMIAFGINDINDSFISNVSGHFGYIYITNGTLPNPYDSVPSYLKGEMKALTTT